MSWPEVTIGQCRLICGDAASIVPTLSNIGAVVTDPPYGLADKLQGGTWGKKYIGTEDWDASCPDITSLLKYPAIIWGGNYFMLPPSRCWLVWYKRDAVRTMADCELAWTNFDANIRLFDWTIAATNAERNGHPTQKPVALMRWCVAKTTGLVCDPYAGSFTTAVACVQLGRPCIAIEIDPMYYAIGVQRVTEAYRQLDLLQPQTWTPARQEALL